LRGARPRKKDRRTIEAIIWRPDDGAKWRTIPGELGDCDHACLRFRRWAVAGVWDRIMAHVVADGEPKLAFVCIDGTITRVHQKAAGARPADGYQPGTANRTPRDFHATDSGRHFPLNQSCLQCRAQDIVRPADAQTLITSPGRT
jgi:transposase